MTYKNDMTRIGCLAMPLCLDLPFFDETNLFISFLERISLFPSQLFFWLPTPPPLSPHFLLLPIDSSVPHTVLLSCFSVPTQCGVCGFHGGCSLPLSPGD